MVEMSRVNGLIDRFLEHKVRNTLIVLLAVAAAESVVDAGLAEFTERSYAKSDAVNTVEESGYTNVNIIDTNKGMLAHIGCVMEGDTFAYLSYDATALEPGSNTEVDLKVCKTIFGGASVIPATQP